MANDQGSVLRGGSGVICRFRWQIVNGAILSLAPTEGDPEVAAFGAHPRGKSANLGVLLKLSDGVVRASKVFFAQGDMHVFVTGGTKGGSLV